MLLPPALGFSPHPPVSVYGTGAIYAIAAFLGTRSAYFSTFTSIRITPSAYRTDLPIRHLLCLHRFLHSRLTLSSCVPTVLIYDSTGISTCCPSATSFDLALGPDLPREDQLYPGNLRYSAWRIPTSISLLIPAFSLPITPLLLTGTASARWQCSSTTQHLLSPQLRCRVSAPDIFGAGPLD